MRVPIRWKITLPYLLLALVIAFGAVQVISRVVFDTVDERFASQLIEAGKLASVGMVDEESRLLENLRLMANVQGVADMLTSGSPEKLRDTLLPITVNNSVELVEILDGKGNLFLSMRRIPGGQLLDYQFTQSGDDSFARIDFVQKVVKSQTDTSGDKYSGTMLIDDHPAFYIAGPIFNDDNGQVGTMLTGTRIRTLVSKLREQTLSQITFYDRSGAPIASTFSNPMNLDANLAANILLTQDWQSPRRDLTGQRDLSASDIDYTEILGPWEVRDKTLDLGLMGVSLAKEFFVKTTQATRLQISLLAAGVLALILLVGINLASRITQPLINLVRASNEVSQGNLDVQVTSNSRDEIDVLSRTFNLMVSNLHQSKLDLENAYDSTLEGWSKALELRDKETKGHSDRVTTLTMILAKELDIEDSRLAYIRRGALLHDIGKMGIPDHILLKEGPLTPEEREMMQRHAQYAYDLLYPIEYLRSAIHIPYSHHEKWDGSGYPKGLKGEEIPVEARIFALVDVWDAITSDRPYRKAMPLEEAVMIIQKGSGSHFDPRLVEVFIRTIQKHLTEEKARP